MRIVFRHMLPSMSSHIIAAATLAIPVMIINETFLSFLGLGMRPPAISWGVLLQEAQNLQSIALAPWLLLPGLAVIVTVLALNILGDGLRDASDPITDGQGQSRPLLSVRDLRTVFVMDEGVAKAVDGVSFDVRPGPGRRHRRRERLRQERDGQVGARHRAKARPHRGRRDPVPAAAAAAEVVDLAALDPPARRCAPSAAPRSRWCRRSRWRR